MSRPVTLRKLSTPPKFKGYKPFGYFSKETEPIKLLYEEYESLILCDYELMTQLEASKLMGISRPTFTRVYERARRKIASAFYDAKQIDIEGGRAYFGKDWYMCNKCNCFFNNPNKNIIIKKCPICSSNKIKHISKEINVNNTKVKE